MRPASRRRRPDDPAAGVAERVLEQDLDRDRRAVEVDPASEGVQPVDVRQAAPRGRRAPNGSIAGNASRPRWLATLEGGSVPRPSGHRGRRPMKAWREPRRRRPRAARARRRDRGGDRGSRHRPRPGPAGLPPPRRRRPRERPPASASARRAGRAAVIGIVGAGAVGTALGRRAEPGRLAGPGGRQPRSRPARAVPLAGRRRPRVRRAAGAPRRGRADHPRGPRRRHRAARRVDPDVQRPGAWSTPAARSVPRSSRRRWPPAPRSARSIRSSPSPIPSGRSPRSMARPSRSRATTSWPPCSADMAEAIGAHAGPPGARLEGGLPRGGGPRRRRLRRAARRDRRARPGGRSRRGGLARDLRPAHRADPRQRPGARDPGGPDRADRPAATSGRSRPTSPRSAPTRRTRCRCTAPLAEREVDLAARPWHPGNGARRTRAGRPCKAGLNRYHRPDGPQYRRQVRGPAGGPLRPCLGPGARAADRSRLGRPPSAPRSPPRPSCAAPTWRR